MVGQSITLEEAEDFLTSDMTLVENVLNGLVPESCTQQEFDPLADFGFNLGVGALRTMLGHGWDQVPQQILRWDKGKNKKGELVQVPGLTRRRKAEVAMFTGGSDA
jgi:GH24 family phage-related lysozyme (muramidase)